MGYRLYKRMSPQALILRDELAIDRTMMANERTFLAYVRTGLSLGVAGASLMRFFETPLAEIVGWALIPAGISLTIIGAVRFGYIAREIRGLRRVQEHEE